MNGMPPQGPQGMPQGMPPQGMAPQQPPMGGPQGGPPPQAPPQAPPMQMMPDGTMAPGQAMPGADPAQPTLGPMEIQQLQAAMMRQGPPQGQPQGQPPMGMPPQQGMPPQGM